MNETSHVQSEKESHSLLLRRRTEFLNLTLTSYPRQGDLTLYLVQGQTWIEK